MSGRNFYQDHPQEEENLQVTIKVTQEVLSSQAGMVQDDVHGEGKQLVMSDIYSLSYLMEPN